MRQYPEARAEGEARYYKYLKEIHRATPYMPDDPALIAKRVEMGEPYHCPKCGRNRNLIWLRLGLPPSPITEAMMAGKCELCEEDVFDRTTRLLKRLTDSGHGDKGKKKE